MKRTRVFHAYSPEPTVTIAAAQRGNPTVPDDPTSLIRSTTAGGAEVAILTFDHGPLNLFDQAMFEAVEANIADTVAHPPRALLLRASGKVTSAGVDVHMFDGPTAAQGADMWNRFLATIIHPLEALPCPVVYAAHGLTLTAAFEIALACDLILASPDAKFGLIESVVGLTPSMGGPQRLAERAGSARARELILTGDLYDAATLKQWGVVNGIHDNVDEGAQALLHRLADGPTRAHAATKEIIAAWRRGDVAEADRITPAVSGALFETSDLRDAVKSFLASGPGNATFNGR
jgi:enoyl-CoA hydratase